MITFGKVTKFSLKGFEVKIFVNSLTDFHPNIFFNSIGRRMKREIANQLNTEDRTTISDIPVKTNQKSRSLGIKREKRASGKIFFISDLHII